VFIVQAAGSQVWTTHAFLTDKIMGIFIDRKFDGFNKNKGVYSFHGGSYQNVLLKGVHIFHFMEGATKMYSLKVHIFSLSLTLRGQCY
jgi:hypothetical protein